MESEMDPPSEPSVIVRHTAGHELPPEEDAEPRSSAGEMTLSFGGTQLGTMAHAEHLGTMALRAKEQRRKAENDKELLQVLRIILRARASSFPCLPFAPT